MNTITMAFTISTVGLLCLITCYHVIHCSSFLILYAFFIEADTCIMVIYLNGLCKVNMKFGLNYCTMYYDGRESVVPSVAEPLHH